MIEHRIIYRKYFRIICNLKPLNRQFWGWAWYLRTHSVDYNQVKWWNARVLLNVNAQNIRIISIWKLLHKFHWKCYIIIVNEHLTTESPLNEWLKCCACVSRKCANVWSINICGNAKFYIVCMNIFDLDAAN